MMISMKPLGAALVLFATNSQAWSVGKLSPRSPVRDERREVLSRRDAIVQTLTCTTSTVAATLLGNMAPAYADDEAVATMLSPVEVIASGDAKSLFNEGRAREMQGNMEAAQRLFTKVTKISPRFIYGWSNLGNAQVALGTLDPAEDSYSTAIKLCQENLRESENAPFGTRKCDDMYILLLNRGCLRLNNGRAKEALVDLAKASDLRGKPDGVVAQNLARARELNGQYAAADREYSLAISMTSSEVNPFWLRSALVKLQLGDIKGGFDLLKRVENRFPEAPEVRAAYATFLAATGEQIAAQRKYLEIPDRQRLNYVNNNYLRNTVSWPPAAIDGLAKVTSVVEKPTAS